MMDLAAQDGLLELFFGAVAGGLPTRRPERAVGGEADAMIATISKKEP